MEWFLKMEHKGQFIWFASRDGWCPAYLIPSDISISQFFVRILFLPFSLSTTANAWGILWFFFSPNEFREWTAGRSDLLFSCFSLLDRTDIQYTRVLMMTPRRSYLCGTVRPQSRREKWSSVPKSSSATVVVHESPCCAPTDEQNV